MKAGDYEEAIARFKEALRLAPATAAAYKNWGDALVLQKKAAEAAAEYRQAIRLNPDYVDAYNNLAAALVAQGRSEEAQAAFEKALVIQPDAIGHYNLALVLAKQGKTAEAVEHLRQAITLASDDAALADRIRRRLNMLESR
jgi:tetratricopeptide (TPR) repeat protein